MRHTLCLVQNVLLLFALLRMTYLGLHAQRRLMFLFLCAWFLSSIFALFAGQVFDVRSQQYAMIFFFCSGFAWLCGTPELMRASIAAAKNLPNTFTLIAVLAMTILAARFAVLNSSFSTLAKELAVNYWIAVIFGATFALASIGAEKPDALLWRCAGAFFLIFGFGHLAIGALRTGPWSYHAAVFAGCMVWFALAFFLHPNHEQIFNLEKLGFTSAALRLFIFPKPGVARKLNG